MPEEATLEPTGQEIAEDVTSDESNVNADTSVSVTQEQLNNDQSKALADILRREKESERTGDPLDLTDEELDLYDKYTDGKLNPAEEKEEKSEEEESKKEKSEKDKLPELPKEIQDALKLTGAKDEKDLLKKVKDLTNNIANKSKDAEYVSKISQEHKEFQTLIKNETDLWEGVKKGDATALKYAEEAYGVVPKNQKVVDTNQKVGSEDGEFVLNTDAFLDEETGKKLNTFIGNMDKKVNDLEKKLEEANNKLAKTEEVSKRAQQDSIRSQANKDLLAETMSMAKEFEDLKDIPNLESMIDSFLKGKGDKLVEDTVGKVFREVQSAKSRGERITLKTAFKMLKADDSELLIRQAESNGRKSAYQEHQASKNLSELQKGGDTKQFRNYTDDEIQGFVEDSDTIPDSFFDENFNPLPKEKLPKKAWKLFY